LPKKPDAPSTGQMHGSRKAGPVEKDKSLLLLVFTALRGRNPDRALILRRCRIDIFLEKEMKMRGYLLEKFKITSIWHFTDEENLAGIRNAGSILATQYLDERGVNFLPGGNEISLELDKRTGMNKYVHCAFIRNHPLEYIARNEYGRNTVWLEISTKILDEPGVLYSKQVANAADAERVPADEVIGDNGRSWVNYLFNTTLQSRYFETFQTICKSDILIPERIPIEYIKGGLQ
jgi:hypothetical protein